jgi:hypothetical protein
MRQCSKPKCNIAKVQQYRNETMRGKIENVKTRNSWTSFCFRIVEKANTLTQYMTVENHYGVSIMVSALGCHKIKQL